MIRPAILADIDAILRLGIDSGMFAPEEVGALRGILEGFHAGTSSAGHELYLWVHPIDGSPSGVVFFGPDMMTDRKWDLWMIAVAPDRQRQGIGGQLLRFAEQRVREANGRVMIIDTSSKPKYDATRAFYANHGFRRVATIPDYYTDGDAKVTYWKRIRTST